LLAKIAASLSIDAGELFGALDLDGVLRDAHGNPRLVYSALETRIAALPRPEPEIEPVIAPPPVATTANSAPPIWSLARQPAPALPCVRLIREPRPAPRTVRSRIAALTRMRAASQRASRAAVRLRAAASAAQLRLLARVQQWFSAHRSLTALGLSAALAVA